MASRKMKETYSINFRKRWWEVLQMQPDAARVAVYDNIMKLLFDGCNDPLIGEAGVIWALIEEDLEMDIKANERKPKVAAGKSFKERRDEFVASLEPYVNQYGKDMMNEFYRYWAQKTKVGEHMLWEVQSAFDLEMRVSNWARKNERKQPAPIQEKGLEEREKAISGIESIRRALRNG